MNTNEIIRKPEPVLTQRRLGWAGLAAIVGCAACCALPPLALAFVGTGAAATLTSFLKPGSELIVGAVVFAGALAVMAVRIRMKQSQGCATSCDADGACCDQETKRGAVG